MVLNTQLEGKEYIAGEYSIADMASIGWINAPQNYDQNLDDFPDVGRWHGTQ